MSPLSTALHQISRLWGALTRDSSSRKIKTADESSLATGPPATEPPPQKISNEQQYHTGSFYPVNHTYTLPPSFSFSDPSSSFGLPFTTPRPGLTLAPAEIEESPSTVSYEEILGTGKHRIAVYEEWCRATNVSMI